MLLEAAAATDACALLMPDMTVDGPAFRAIEAALTKRNITPHILRRSERAVLDASQDAETLLNAALGGKKLKELRRQGKRLADCGPVEFGGRHTARASHGRWKTFSRSKHKAGKACAELPRPEQRRRRLHPAAAAASGGAGPVRDRYLDTQRRHARLRPGPATARRAFFFKVAFDETRGRKPHRACSSRSN